MAGNLPFDEPNLPSLFKKISRAEYPIPTWFTPDMTSLLKAMLNPSVKKRYALSNDGEWAHCISSASVLVRFFERQSETGLSASKNSADSPDLCRGTTFGQFCERLMHFSPLDHT